jgi:hypothetical protein
VERLIVPTGILSFLLFLIALASGYNMRRFRKHHAVSGYLCLLVTVVHSTAAIMCQILEPLGILASLGMIFTILSGRLWGGKPSHRVLAFITLAFSVAHVAFIKIAAG